MYIQTKELVNVIEVIGLSSWSWSQFISIGQNKFSSDQLFAQTFPKKGLIKVSIWNWLTIDDPGSEWVLTSFQRLNLMHFEHSSRK